MSDTGAGIPEEQLPHIFERFHRVEGTRARTHEGTGIGLALVQELVKLHQGKISLRSVPGQGSTFTVTLPLGQGHLPAERIGSPGEAAETSIVAGSYAVEASRWLGATSEDDPPLLRGLEGGIQNETAGARARRPRILLADDNADMRAYVLRLLAERYEVKAVTDGEAALAAARADRPDLVLSDVMMPGLDGFGLLARLRSDPVTAEIPVIMLSARAGEEARIEGLQSGADDYLTKPFGARELLARVRAMLDLVRVRREAAAALRESEARYRALVTASSDAVYRMNPDWTEMQRLDGREFISDTPEPSRSWLEKYIHPDDQPHVMEAINQAIRTKGLFELEHRVLRVDGTMGWTFSRAIPVLDGNGEITQWFGTASDVTRRKQAEEERERLLKIAQDSRETAEIANRMKDEFLATLSHELRTPLNAILGWAKMLRSGKLDADDMQQGVEVIERNSRAQAQLIEDLLDVSRIISGKLTLDVKRIHLQDVIEAAVAAVMPAANAKGVRFHQVLDSLVSPLAGDATRLQQVVWNLLSNAVKFTPKGGTVQVLLERVNSHVELSVVDTGMGIRPDFLPYVFERFRQADPSTTRRHGGLGLGLSIVKQLVEMHGGSVRAKSPGEGQGATFVVSLPISSVHHDPDAVSSRPPQPAELTAESRLLADVHVLVVDDEPDARHLVERILTACHAKVALADSAAGALRLVELVRPDVLISDIGMPGEDGYDLIRKIRARHNARDLPAAALTAFARSEDRRRAMLAGFQTHGSKPVDPGGIDRGGGEPGRSNRLTGPRREFHGRTCSSPFRRRCKLSNPDRRRQRRFGHDVGTGAQAAGARHQGCLRWGDRPGTGAEFSTRRGASRPEAARHERSGGRQSYSRQSPIGQIRFDCSVRLWPGGKRVEGFRWPSHEARGCGQDSGIDPAEFARAGLDSRTTKHKKYTKKTRKNNLK